jgi:hypothetical protein
MRDRGEQLLKLKPLDKKRDDVLRLITSKQGIVNPKNVFKVSILDRSRHSLESQLGLEEKHMMDLVSRREMKTIAESDVDVAIFKYL